MPHLLPAFLVAMKLFKGLEECVRVANGHDEPLLIVGDDGACIGRHHNRNAAREKIEHSQR